MDDVSDDLAARLAAGDAAALAEEHGLARIGSRPALGAYIRSLWSRRYFIGVLATSRAYARNQNTYLGQLWALLNPLLWAGVYLFVFGVLLDTSRGVDNFIGFLVIGVFMFRFTSSSVTAGAKAITSNLALVRSLHFPRALLPMSIVLAELATLVPAVLVLCVIVLITGEPLTWSWLLFPVAVIVQWIFNTGFSFILARLVAQARDLLNVLPFVLRGLMYTSGVFFSIDHYVGTGVLGSVLAYQPVAVYLTLARSCLLQDFPPDPLVWGFGVGWALLFAVGGFLFFWRAEEKYGRD